MDYSQMVFMVRTQSRTLNLKLPHQILDDKDAAGTAFYFLYKKKIHLVTCFHVIRSSYIITVSSPSVGSQEYPCRVRWICPHSDLAVLEIDRDSIPVKTKNNIIQPTMALTGWDFKQKKNIIAGPPVAGKTVIVGYPLGQTNLKINNGILSGQQMGLFQTDAPMNGGNSGGPLLWKNKIIGINSSGISRAQNVGYAIPVQRLTRLIDFHERHPTVYHIRPPRTWGIEVCPPASFPDAKTKHNAGVEVRQIFPHQLMYKTRLRKNDILLRINGMSISSLGELPLTWLRQKMTIHNYFHHLYLGQKIQIEYRSGKHNRTETITVEPESDAIRYRTLFNEHEPIPYLYLAGIVMIPLCENFMDDRHNLLKYTLDEEERQENHFLIPSVDVNDPALVGWSQPMHWHEGRLVISNIMTGSLIYDTHAVKMGDLIETINGTTITTIPQAERIIGQSRKTQKDIRIETHKGCVINLSAAMIQAEDKKLAQIYNFPINQ